MVFALTRCDMDLFCLRKTRLNVSVASGAIAEADNLSAQERRISLVPLGIVYVCCCLLAILQIFRAGRLHICVSPRANRISIADYDFRLPSRKFHIGTYIRLNIPRKCCLRVTPWTVMRPRCRAPLCLLENLFLYFPPMPGLSDRIFREQTCASRIST